MKCSLFRINNILLEKASLGSGLLVKWGEGHLGKPSNWLLSSEDKKTTTTHCERGNNS